MEDNIKNFDIENIGASLLKGKKKGRPKKEEKPTTTTIWVVTSILGVEAAFIDEAELKQYALGYNKLGLNTFVWRVEDGKSTKAGHITNFKK
jgi:hypothetical protein